jgi:hypothetical protein
MKPIGLCWRLLALYTQPDISGAKRNRICRKNQCGNLWQFEEDVQKFCESRTLYVSDFSDRDTPQSRTPLLLHDPFMGAFLHTLPLHSIYATYYME